MTPATLTTLSHVLHEKRVALLREIDARSGEGAALRSAQDELRKVMSAINEVEGEMK